MKMTKSNMDRIVILACTLLIFTASSCSGFDFTELISTVGNMEKDVERSVRETYNSTVDGMNAAASGVSDFVASVKEKTVDAYHQLDTMYENLAHISKHLNNTLFENIAIVREGEEKTRHYIEKEVTDMMFNSMGQLFHSAGNISEKCNEIHQQLNIELEEALTQSDKCINAVIDGDIQAVAEFINDVNDVVNDVTDNNDLMAACNDDSKYAETSQQVAGCLGNMGQTVLDVGINAGSTVMDGEIFLQLMIKLPLQGRSCYKHHTLVPMEASIKKARMELLECTSPSAMYYGRNLLSSIRNQTIDIFHHLETTYHAASVKVRHINKTLHDTIANLRSEEREARHLILTQIRKKLSKSLEELKNSSGNDSKCTEMEKQLELDLENALKEANICIDTKIDADIEKLAIITEGVMNLKKTVTNNEALVEKCIANLTVKNALTKAKKCLHNVRTELSGVKKTATSIVKDAKNFFTQVMKLPLHGGACVKQHVYHPMTTTIDKASLTLLQCVSSTALFGNISFIERLKNQTIVFYNRLNNSYYDTLNKVSDLNKTLHENIEHLRNKESEVRESVVLGIRKNLSTMLEKMANSTGIQSENFSKEIREQLDSSLEKALEEAKECIDVTIDQDIVKVQLLVKDLTHLYNNVTDNSNLIDSCTNDLSLSNAIATAKQCIENIHSKVSSVMQDVKSVYRDAGKVLAKVAKLPLDEGACYKQHVDNPMTADIVIRLLKLSAIVDPSTTTFGRNVQSTLENETTDMYKKLQGTYNTTVDKVHLLNETLFEIIAHTQAEKNKARISTKAEIQEMLSADCTDVREQMYESLEKALGKANDCTKKLFEAKIVEVAVIHNRIKHPRYDVASMKNLLNNCTVNLNRPGAHKLEECLQNARGEISTVERNVTYIAHHVENLLLQVEGLQSIHDSCLTHVHNLMKINMDRAAEKHPNCVDSPVTASN